MSNHYDAARDPLLNNPLGSPRQTTNDTTIPKAIPGSRYNSANPRPLLQRDLSQDTDKEDDSHSDDDSSWDESDDDEYESDDNFSLKANQKRLYRRTNRDNHGKSSASKPFPTRSALIALFLLITGIIFLSVFLYRQFISEDHAHTPFSENLPFIFLAFITLVPGSYHIVIILFTLLNVPGYSYDIITSSYEY